MSDTELSPLSFDWLREWDRHMDSKRQRSYVSAELDRLQAEGQPLLMAAITAPLPDQQDIALSELRSRGYRPKLRLREGASPPSVDSQGRPLSKDEVGKVFRTKTGVRGSSPEAKADPVLQERYVGPARNALARTREGLYQQVDITHEPQTFSVDEASAILRNWGVGVRSKRFRGHRDTYLVEEVVSEAAKPKRPKQ